MGFFDSQRGGQPAMQGRQMDQRQLQQMAQRELDQFASNLPQAIQRSGVEFPAEIRGNVPEMCRWLLRTGKAQNVRIAQPLIDRLLGGMR